jgi:transposase
VKSRNDIAATLGRWDVELRQVPERMWRAPTPRARTLARPLAAGPGVVGQYRRRGAGARSPPDRGLARRLRPGWPRCPGLRVHRLPPALEAEAQASLKVAVQATPADVGIALANWHWQVVRRFIEARRGIRLSRSACLRYLHRPGFVYQRPKKRLLKADAAKRAACVEEDAALLVEAQASGATICFVGEAPLRADGDPRGQWLLRGHPALVDSTCPRWGEQASDSSAVCLETGKVEAMEPTGTSSSATGAAVLRQLRAHHPEPLMVSWDNGPAHGGEAVRAYPATPDRALRVLRLPADSPDCDADEAIRAWAREEVTANTCPGTKDQVREQMTRFFDGLTTRTAEVPSRCRSKSQALAEAVTTAAPDLTQEVPM